MGIVRRTSGSGKTTLALADHAADLVARGGDSSWGATLQGLPLARAAPAEAGYAVMFSGFLTAACPPVGTVRDRVEGLGVAWRGPSRTGGTGRRDPVEVGLDPRPMMDRYPRILGRASRSASRLRGSSFDLWRPKLVCAWHEPLSLSVSSIWSVAIADRGILRSLQRKHRLRPTCFISPTYSIGPRTEATR